MSDTIASPRVEPVLSKGPTSPAPSASAGDLDVSRQPVARVVVRDNAPPAAATSQVSPNLTDHPSSVSDQLARLEDKTARIEEKLARSEAATQRVVDRFEAASHRMSEVAQQVDLAAVRGDVNFIARRVRNLPGISAAVAIAVVTAALTAVAVVLVLRYVPGASLR